MSALRLLVCLAVAIAATHCSFVWYQQRPELDDPCTLLVIGPKRGTILSVHPPSHCTTGGGVMWYATYGRILVYLTYDGKPDFELCLTSGSPKSLYVWWDSGKEAWHAISPPINTDEVPRRDSCRNSTNGIMNLILEPPWAWPYYEAYMIYEINFIETNNSTGSTGATANTTTTDGTNSAASS